MRLPLIPPAELTPQQKSLYDEMRKGIASNFNAFKVEREDGALMGPWNPWLHEPQIGGAIWDLTLAMTANAVLKDNVRQIAILAVGAHFKAAYELYAHIAVAEAEKLAWETPIPHLFLPDFAEARVAEIFAEREPSFAHAA